MNENIIQAIDEYMINPDPQYALMIKGRWGCGKTFFVKKWIETQENTSDVDKVLKPIYVSLYGLKTTHDITTAINKVLYPRLYGKAAKVGKSVLKIVSGIVLHHEIDIDGDDKGDLKLDLPLDSLAILNANDEQIKNDKFLFFDDIERSQIGMKQLLGYINYFVEQCHCHVVIVGDDTKVVGESKTILDDFKEKTIGREMMLQPDIEGAIYAFVESLGDFVKKHITQICKTFELSGCGNLRILRQCLWDFNQLEIRLNPIDDKRYEEVMTSMLCCFVATYCEYKGNNKQVLAEWSQNSATANNFKDEELKKVREQLQTIMNKYSACPAYTYHPVFYMPFVMPIVKYIETGADMNVFMAEQIKPISVKSSWERMEDAYMMSNEDFAKFYIELVDDICNNRILSKRDLGYTLAYICCWDAKGITSPTAEQKQIIKNTLYHVFDGIQTHELLLDSKRHLFEGCNSLITDMEMPLWNEMLEIINSAFENHLAQTQDSMTMVLENLTDSNCDTLMEMDESALPDHSTTYNSVSIFNHIDVQKVFNGIKSMSNKGRQDFNSFIRKRYLLSYTMSNWIHETKDDIQPLEKLHDMVVNQASQTAMMEHESYNRIAHSLQGAINRCKGDLNAQ